jgi:hypothetical protein
MYVYVYFSHDDYTFSALIHALLSVNGTVYDKGVPSLLLISCASFTAYIM